MNPVEDRLRDALHAHAEDFTAHPDAWQQLRAKTKTDKGSRLARIGIRTGIQRRPGRVLVWSRFVLPVAAATAVIAIVLGAAALTGPGSPRGGSGTAPASPFASGAPAPPGRSDYLIQQDPPVSSIVQVKLTVAGQPAWVSVWFGRMKDDPGSTVLCSEIAHTGYPVAGFCQHAQIPAGHSAVVTYGDDVITVGVASAQVASVSEQSPSGSGTGKLIWSRGFPAKVWLAGNPILKSSQIVFRSATGLEVGKLTIGMQTPTSHPHSGGIVIARYPAGFQEPASGTITAYLADGQLGLWTSGYTPVGYSTVPVSEQPGLIAFLVRTQLNLPGKLVQFYGYAPQNVVRVTLRLADGRQFSAPTVAGWKGSGLRLWSLSVPGGVSSTARYVALGYDAANQVVSQLTVSSPNSY